MGNIYYKQQKYLNAVKYYKKGLDQIPKQFKNLRMKIMKNIGHSCLKIGKFNDAIQA